MVKVLIVEDHDMARMGLSVILGNNPNIEIADMSADGQEVTEDITLTPGMFKLEGSPVSSFEAGYTYTLTLIIYGLQDIKIKATVDQWEEGGSTEWDPEDAFTQGN